MCIAQNEQLDVKTIINIPVIFHVINSGKTSTINSDGRNINENLPTSLLLLELKDLHQDFMLKNEDTLQVIPHYKSLISSANVNFFLADTILQANGEKGIIRVYNRNNRRNLHRKSKVISPDKFLNVYIGNTGSFTPSSPWLFPEKDAVFLSYAWVGQNYRLLTHEVGHWLGLFHLWGNGGGKGDKNSCSIGDGIADTPEQYEATEPNGDCLTCPSLGSGIDKTCDKTNHKPSNFNNFMDYSGCRRMFTKGQVVKLRMTIKDNRKRLWKSY